MSEMYTFDTVAESDYDPSTLDPSLAIDTEVETLDKEIEMIVTMLEDEDKEVEAFEKFSETLDKLEGFCTKITTYGFTPIQLVEHQYLFETTAIPTYGLENFKNPLLANDFDLVGATENIIGAIVDKIGEWAKKIVDVIGAIVGKIWNIVTYAFKKIFGLFKKIKDLAVDAFSWIVDSIKNHPFQTLILFASGIASVPAIVGLVTKSSLPASVGLISKYYANIITKFSQSGLGKLFKLKLDNASVAFTKTFPQMRDGTPTALGYTVQKVKNLYSGLIKLFSEQGPFKGIITTLKSWGQNAWTWLKAKDQMLSAQKKGFIGKIIRFIWVMFKESFTTPLGLLFTCVSKIFSSLGKIKAGKKRREEEQALRDRQTNQAQKPQANAPEKPKPQDNKPQPASTPAKP